MGYFEIADSIQLFYHLPSCEEDSLYLIFLHGGGGNRELWYNQVSYFQNKYKTVVFDLPGHGKVSSSEPLLDVPYSIKGIKDLIENEFINHPVVICGHSYAGFILFGLLKESLPNLIGLIFLDCPYYKDVHEIQERINLAKRMLSLSPQKMELITNQWYRNMTGGNLKDQDQKLILDSLSQVNIEWMYKCMLHSKELLEIYPSKKQINESNIQFLIIEGEKSLFRSPDRSYRQALANSQYQVIQNSNHFCFLEKPQIVNYFIKKFLEYLIDSN
ncbi:MAG: alpha/beta fold hydrolase [Candidatus Hodarchaeota archaeon]